MATMDNTSKDLIIDLRVIPGIGPSLAQDLNDLGFHSVLDLKQADPEKMYNDLVTLRRTPIDHCVLYVFRCAVYFADTDNHDPEKLKWWNWKDRESEIC